MPVPLLHYLTVGAILYYRGGIHDWVTLGYPVIPGQAASDEPFA